MFREFSFDGGSTAATSTVTSPPSLTHKAGLTLNLSDTARAPSRPCLQDHDISPFTVRETAGDCGSLEQPSSSTDYFSLDRRRKESLSQSIQNLTLSSNSRPSTDRLPTPPQTAPLASTFRRDYGLASPETSPPPPSDMQWRQSFCSSPEPQDHTRLTRMFVPVAKEPPHPPAATRLQRQILTQLQSAPSQMRCLSALVQDMVAQGELCTISEGGLPPSPPPSRNGGSGDSDSGRSHERLVIRVRRTVTMQRRQKARSGSTVSVESSSSATAGKSRISKRACSWGSSTPAKTLKRRLPVRRASYYAPRDSAGDDLALFFGEHDSGVEDLEMV